MKTDFKHSKVLPIFLISLIPLIILIKKTPNSTYTPSLIFGFEQ